MKIRTPAYVVGMILLLVLSTTESRAAQKSRFIEHPLASKGLERIEADGSYLYRTEPGTRSQSSSFRFGTMPAPEITSEDAQVTFETMYGASTVPIFEVSYEWQPFTTFGKLGLLGGVGFLTVSGNGHFKNGDESIETYTLIGLPMTLAGVYRFEFSSTQFIAPYVMAGGTHFGLIEIRDDGKTPTVASSFSGMAAGGVLINIGKWDRFLGPMLQSEYGISNMWLNLEGRLISTVSESIKFSGGYFTAGMTFDF